MAYSLIYLDLSSYVENKLLHLTQDSRHLSSVKIKNRHIPVFPKKKHYLTLY